jgi:sugar phosphate isomerase/epimerase
MKFAVSNIALGEIGLDSGLPYVTELGFDGLELSLPLTWPNGVRQIGAEQITGLRRRAESSGLAVIGLHGLLDGALNGGLYRGEEAMNQAVETVIRASELCRDLGGRTLVLGGHRFRGDRDDSSAWAEILRFLEQVLPAIEDHGTMLCLEPMGPASADFCQCAAECRLLVNYVDHPSFGIQLGSAALLETGDLGHAPYAAVRGRLEIFHITEPGLACLGTTGRIDHADLRRHLAAITYREWVSLHQCPTERSWYSLAASAQRLQLYYLRPDNLSLGRLRHSNTTRQ